MAGNELTRNWQKANIARTYFHDGIVEVVCVIITEIHERLVRPKIEYGERDEDVQQCDRGENKRCVCQKPSCQAIYDDVIELHVCTMHSRLENWHRCFCYDKLAVAACFLTLHEPHERKRRHLTSLNEVDSLGLLTMLDNCSLESQRYFNRNLLIKAIDIHTSITRNAKNETERDVLFEFLDVLTSLLQKLDANRYPSAVMAITNIEQLKTDESDLGPHAIELTTGKFYDPTKELGRGRFAVVYEGRSGCYGVMFKAAVKQILYRERDKSLVKELSEAKIMQVLECKRHPNVVGYYEIFHTATHLYIFTELYDGTLDDYVKDSYAHLRTTFDATRVNRCLTEGLNFLHSEGVVHRDLKPSNIFIRLDGKNIIKVAIGDFGSAKLCRMKFEYSATMSCASVPGTVGFVSPEVWAWYENDMEEDEKKTFTVKSDTFSLGLIFYCTVSTGKHPFGRGSGFRIQQRIQNSDKPDLSAANIEYQGLIRNMIQIDIKERMFAEDVLKHPALWTSEQILNYLKEKSNYLVDCNEPNVAILRSKLDSLDIIRSTGWLADLPITLRKHLTEGRCSFQGREHSLVALLRAIRNTEHHIDDFPELAGGPDFRVGVWRKACPALLIGVYNAFKDHKPDTEVVEQHDDDDDEKNDEDEQRGKCVKPLMPIITTTNTEIVYCREQHDDDDDGKNDEDEQRGNP